MNLEEVKKYFDTEIGYEDGTKMLMLIADSKNMEGVSFVQRLTNCSFEIAQQMWGILKNQYGTKETNPMIPDLTPQQIAAANAQAQEWLNKPKCPTCGSTNVEKISFGKKAVGGALFGLLSSDVRKSMHCKNCGYKW